MHRGVEVDRSIARFRNRVVTSFFELVTSPLVTHATALVVELTCLSFILLDSISFLVDEANTTATDGTPCIACMSIKR